MKYTLHNISSITGGTLHRGTAPDVIRHLLLDSRKLLFPSDSLFFALKGRRDGHEYVADLYQKGVRNFVVSYLPSASLPEANWLLVENPLLALQTLAAYHRSLFDIPVIGISGSNGKTIVKEWINQLLNDRFQVVRSPRSYNSQVGVPLSIWQMQETHDLGIFEAGISQPGEMQRLQQIIQPTIGVFTNIGPAHDEGFHSMQQKAAEKARLFSNSDVIIYSRDHNIVNEAILAAANNHPVELFTWGSAVESTLRILDVSIDNLQSTIVATYHTDQYELTIPFTDQASIENAIHCWCVLIVLKIPFEEIVGRMSRLTAVAMRLELKQGINHCSIINDAYNADLASLGIALDFLAQQSQHPKKTVILSDFLESGKNPAELYLEVGTQLKRRNIDRLIGIGQMIGTHRYLFEEAGIPELEFYPNTDAFKAAFAHIHFSNESILLKGARMYELESLEVMLEEKVHQTVMEINLDALVSNLHQYQSKLNPSTKLMAMVKAFSYGSGSYEIASVLQFQKIDYLAVAYTDEGIDLRKGGIRLPVMVMNADTSSFEALVQYDLEPVIYSVGMLQRFITFLESQGVKDFPVHVELETGMHRLGFAESETEELVLLLAHGNVHVKSLFTHLVASEEPGQDPFTETQARLFISQRDKIVGSLGYPVLSHISNTSGISRHLDMQLDMVRLGIGLYGIDYSRTMELAEVSTLKSTIAQIKLLEAGETVGYNRSGVVNRSSIIATVRIGYADGYPRSLSNGLGKMLVGGQLASVIGTVCMDMTMVDITGIEGVAEGDEVIVFGPGLPVTVVASWAGTIAYELLTGISQRVKRVYYRE